MSELLSDDKILKLRQHHERGKYGGLSITIMGLLATIDARDKRIAELEAELELLRDEIQA